MSLLNSKINGIEAEVLDVSANKANAAYPTFQGAATFTGPVVLSDAVSFSSSNITGLTKATVGLGNVQNIDAAAYTDRQIQTLVQGAPAVLNTITELAAAINNEPNYYIDINNRCNILNRMLSQSTDALGNTTTTLTYNDRLRIVQDSSTPITIDMTTLQITLYAPTAVQTALTVAGTDVGATLQNLSTAQQILTSLINTTVKPI